MTILLRIKRCCLTDRIVYTAKADAERVESGLSHGDVVEAITNAPAIYKTLRSTSAHRRSRGERVYVIVGLTHDAVLVYTKGVLRRQAGEEYFYVLVSAKRSIEP